MAETMSPIATEHPPRGRLMALAFAVAVGTWLWTDVPASQDDVLHHLLAREGLFDPRLLLDIWGRAGFSVLHALPAQLGFRANQAFSLLLALATALLVQRALRARGPLVAELGAAFTLAQTYAFQLSFGTMTETVCALALALGIERWQRGKVIAAALAFSWTGITRLEALPLLGVIGLFILCDQRQGHSLHKRFALALLLGVWPLLWNLLLFIEGGFEQPFALVTANSFVQSAPGAYGQGHVLKFLLHAPHIFGLGVFAALLFGWTRAWRLSFRLEITYFLVFFSLQSLLWAFGLFRTAGYERFFASIAPIAAILAALGVESMVARFRGLARFGAPRIAWVLVVLNLAHAVTWNVIYTEVMRQNHDSVQAAIAQVRQLLQSAPSQPLLVADETYAAMDLVARPFDLNVRRSLAEAGDLRHLPAGTVILLTAGPHDDLRGFAEISEVPADPELRARLTASELRGARPPWFIHRLTGTNPYFEHRRDFHVVRDPRKDPVDEPWPYWVTVVVRSTVPAPAEERSAWPR